MQALRGVTLSVPEGKIVTVLGANGAGKTTILKTISGILDPSKGTVEFHGENITALDPAVIVRKVVKLPRALATEPKLLLLDEPSSGLNVEETGDMAFWIEDILKDLGITVLMVEHDMTLFSRVSDRVLAMNQGQVLATGTPAEVQAHPGVIEAYLGTADDAASLRRKAA